MSGNRIASQLLDGRVRGTMKSGKVGGKRIARQLLNGRVNGTVKIGKVDTGSVTIATPITIAVANLERGIFFLPKSGRISAGRLKNSLRKKAIVKNNKGREPGGVDHEVGRHLDLTGQRRDLGRVPVIKELFLELGHSCLWAMGE